MSFFDGSLISEREMKERGISFYKGLLQNLRQPNQVPVPHVPAPFPITAFDKIPTLVLNSPASAPPRLPTPASSPVDLIPNITQPNPNHFVDSYSNSEVHMHTLHAPQLTLNNNDMDNRSSSNSQQSSEDGFVKNIYGFDISRMLLSNSVTRDVITKKIEENRFILRADRQAVAAVLIDAIIDRAGTNPSKHALEQLAKHLVMKYPSLGDPRRQERGWQMWFYHTIKGLGATGFLEDRLKNQRKRLAKKKSNTVDKLVEIHELDWESEDDNENPIPDDSQLEYLKHNFGSDIPSVMKSTVFMKRSLLRAYHSEQFPGLQKAIQKMPRLFDTENMIIQDFNVRHPSIALILYDLWPKVSKLLLEYAEESGVCYKKKLDVAKHRYDLSEADICLLAYCLLPYILPSCGRKMTADCRSDDEEDENAFIVTTKRRKQPTGSRKRQATVKASDLDSLRRMICFKSRNTHVSEVLGENKRIAPFILALGSSGNLEFVQFFVIIYKVAIPCGPSFMTALDTCFKCFTVLYLPLPIESFDHWQFIQHGVCGKPVKDTELPPVVQALLGQIMTRI